VAVLLAGCASAPPGAPPPSSPSAPLPLPSPSSSPSYGVAFTPAGHDVAGFFKEAPQLGSVVLWGGPAEQLGQESAAPAVVATLAPQHGLRVAIQTDFVRANASFDANGSTAAAVAFAKRYHPAYFALAVEADRLRDSDPAAFDRLATWYPGAYAAVEAASPDTKVLVTWQYEHLAQAGAWDLLPRIAPRDLDAFTTYPAIALPDASRLPADYYANLTAHASAPVAFFEVGHPGDDPAKQAAFVDAFFAAANATRPALVLWFEVHDQPDVTPALFRHMGLVDDAGQRRPSWDAWRAHAGGS